MSAEQLLCVDIQGIVSRPEPMGRGWECHVEGDPRRHARGDTQDEAVGSLIRRLALEHEGANWRRERADPDPTPVPGDVEKERDQWADAAQRLADLLGKRTEERDSARVAAGYVPPGLRLG